MSASRDLYEESEQLAESLVQRGEGDAADRIRDVIEGGSTSLEILFALREEFDRLLDSGEGLDTELSAWVADLRQAAEDALA